MRILDARIVGIGVGDVYPKTVPTTDKQGLSTLIDEGGGGEGVGRGWEQNSTLWEVGAWIFGCMPAPLYHAVLYLRLLSFSCSVVSDSL